MEQAGGLRSPRGLEPRTARGVATREALLAAAEAVFGEVGYERAAITAITLRAGVGLGTFYRYFPGKKEIFVELVHELSRRVRHAIALATEGHADRRSLERAALEGFWQFVLEHPGLYRIVRQAEFVDEATYRWYFEVFVDGYRRNIQAAVDRGEVKAVDTEMLAYLFLGIANQVGMRWVLWEQRPPPKKVVDDLFNVLWEGMAGQA